MWKVASCLTVKETVMREALYFCWNLDIFGYAGGRVCLTNFLVLFSLKEFFASTFRFLDKYFEYICGFFLFSLYSPINYMVLSH